MILRISPSSIFLRFIAGLSLLVLTGCEEEIVPLAPMDGIFSINGYLDAAADTQWVRVTPFRTTILTIPDPVDAVVTLENLGTGAIIEMHPSVFTFPSPNFDGAAYGHNFWTDEPIERGVTYRLTARRSDGESSTAVVKIPHSLIDTTVRVSVDDRIIGGARTANLRFDIPSGDHLAFLSLDHYRKFPHPCTPPSNPIDHDLYRLDGERPKGPLTYEWGPVRRHIAPDDLAPCDRQQYIRWTASIVFSGESWPFKPGDFIGYLDQGSNIENGMGYLGGVAWERIAVPFCSLDGIVNFQPCDLFFGPESVTLDVLVRYPDGRLAQNHPLPLFIRLRKEGETSSRSGDVHPFALPDPLDFVPDPPLTITRFPGLLPGTYRIHARLTVTEVPLVIAYCEERTVVLTPGEHRTIEIQTMVRHPIPTEPLNANGCREG